MPVMNETMPPLPSKAGYETDDPIGRFDRHQRSILVDAVRQVWRDIADDFQS
jgi:hypothetical protein